MNLKSVPESWCFYGVVLDDYGRVYFLNLFHKSKKVRPLLTKIQPGPECPNKLPSVRRLGFIQASVHHSVDCCPWGIAAGTFQLTFRLFHLFLGDWTGKCCWMFQRLHCSSSSTNKIPISLKPTVVHSPWCHLVYPWGKRSNPGTRGPDSSG